MRNEPRVLVVEDDEVLARMLTLLLSSEEIDSRAIGCGNQALLAFMDGQYDLVILDLGLPGMNGLELCRRLRALAPRVGLIVLSGGGPECRNEALLAGADLFLRKPFDMNEFHDGVRALLSGSVVRLAA